MERFLIFGDTPIANRLTWYLRHYAEVKNLGMAIRRISLDSESTIDYVQKAVWSEQIAGVSGRTELVINAHEESDLSVCASDPELAWRNNTVHATWIAYAALTANIPLVQLSTDHVFRGDRGPYGIGGTPNPINMYGTTKWYAEMLTQHLHPKSTKIEAGVASSGTTIVRTSELYGYDVDSVPRGLTRLIPGEGTTVETETSGVIRVSHAMSPSFIGEVAFLIARNILLSPGSLNIPVIHIASNDPTITWSAYLHDLGCKVIHSQSGEDKLRGGLERQGTQRGLIPTEGWYLPTGSPSKSFNDSLSEYEGKSYIKYWND
jgi:dTDP-4-dehydrorhamnose reductase